MRIHRALMVVMAAGVLCVPATQLAVFNAPSAPTIVMQSVGHSSINYSWAGGPDLEAIVAGTGATTTDPVNLTIAVSQAYPYNNGGCNASAFDYGSSVPTSITVTPTTGVATTSPGNYAVTGYTGATPLQVEVGDSSNSEKCVSVAVSVNGGTAVTGYAPYVAFSADTNHADPGMLYVAGETTPGDANGGQSYNYGLELGNYYTEPVVVTSTITSCTFKQYLQADDTCDASTTAPITTTTGTTQSTIPLSTAFAVSGSGDYYGPKQAPAGYVPGDLHSVSVTVYPVLSTLAKSEAVTPIYKNKDLSTFYAGNTNSEVQEQAHATLSSGATSDTILVTPQYEPDFLSGEAAPLVTTTKGVTEGLAMDSYPITVTDTLYGPIPAVNGACPNVVSAYASAPQQPGTLPNGGESTYSDLNSVASNNIMTTTPISLGTKYGCYAWEATAIPSMSWQVDELLPMVYPLSTIDYAAPLAPSTTTSVLSTSVITINHNGTVTDTATVAGNAKYGAPTGTVQFYVCGPNKGLAVCPAASANAVGTPVTLSPSTTGDTSQATSSAYKPSTGGKYAFAVIYNPAANSNYIASNDNTTGTAVVDDNFVATPPPVKLVTGPPTMRSNTTYALPVGLGVATLGLATGTYVVIERKKRIGRKHEAA